MSRHAVVASCVKVGSGIAQALFTRIMAVDPPELSQNAPATVDPLKRYQHYEKAYLDGELSEDQRAEVERLLATDEAARVLLEELRQYHQAKAFSLYEKQLQT